MRSGRERGEDEDESADGIRDAERARLRALVHRDMEAAGPLHGDDFQLITPGGDALTKEQYLGSIASGDLTYHVFEPVSPIAVRIAGAQAVIRYQSQIEVTVEGTHLALTHCWHTDLYERQQGRWQVVWSQATRISDA